MNKKIIGIVAALLSSSAVVVGTGGWIVSNKAAHLVQENALEMLQTQYPVMKWNVGSSSISYFPWPAVNMPSVTGVAVAEDSPIKSVEIQDLTGHVDILALNKKDVPPISSLKIGHIHAVYSDAFITPGKQGEMDLTHVVVRHFDKANPWTTFEGSIKDTSLKPIIFKGDASAENIMAIQKDYRKTSEWSLKAHLVAQADGDKTAKPVELLGKVHAQNGLLYSDLHIQGDPNAIKSDSADLNIIPNIKDADLNASLTAPAPDNFKDIPTAPWELVSFYGTVKSVQAEDLIEKAKSLHLIDIPKQAENYLSLAKDISFQDITFLTHEKRLHAKLSLLNGGQNLGQLELDSPLELPASVDKVGALDVSFTGLGKDPAHYALHTTDWDNKKSDISFEVALPENDRTSMQLSDLWKVSAAKNDKGSIQNKLSAQGQVTQSDNGFEVNLGKVHGELNGAKIEGNVVAAVAKDLSKLQGMTANFQSPQLYVTENSKSVHQKSTADTASLVTDNKSFNNLQDVITQWVTGAEKIRINFKPASLAFNEVTYRHPSFYVEIKDGKGKISATDERTEGGSLLADIAWDMHAKPTKWSLSGHPMMVPSSYLAYLLGQSHLVEGPVYLTGNLELTGYTEEEFMRTAKGSLGVAMHEGQIRKEALLPLVGKWSSFLSVLVNGNIPLRCAGTVTDWDAGTMKIKHLGIIAKHVSISGDGSEEFKNHLLQLTLQPRLTVMGRSVSRTVSLESRKDHFSIEDGAVDKNYQLGMGGKAHESCESLFAESRLGEEQKKLSMTGPGQAGFDDILSGK